MRGVVRAVRVLADAGRCACRAATNLVVCTVRCGCRTGFLLDGWVRLGTCAIAFVPTAGRCGALPSPPVKGGSLGTLLGDRKLERLGAELGAICDWRRVLLVAKGNLNLGGCVTDTGDAEGMLRSSLLASLTVSFGGGSIDTPGCWGITLGGNGALVVPGALAVAASGLAGIGSKLNGSFAP